MDTARPQCDGDYPLLIVLSGPSGVGKDAVLARMMELGKPYHFAVTATTRPRRPNERNRVDYIFVTAEAFRQLVENGDLMEWAEVYGNQYGVPKSQIAWALNNGRDVIIQVDVQGAATVRKIAPDAVFIFLAPPDMEELARRLSQRMTESPEALELRLETAASEMKRSSEFDHVVVNHKARLDDTVEEIERIVIAERHRNPARKVML